MRNSGRTDTGTPTPHGPSSGTRPWQVAVVAVLAGLALPFAFWVAFLWSPAPADVSPAAVSTVQAAPAGGSSASPSSSEGGDAQGATPGMVLVIGDQYARGDGAEPGQGYVGQLADSLGSEAAARHTIGGGWVTEGTRGDFAALVEDTDLASVDPDLVIVQGGFNDVQVASGSAIREAAGQAIGELRQALPGVPVVVLGVLSPGEDDPAVTRANTALRRAVEDVADDSVVFVGTNGGEWRFSTTDGSNPDQAGHDLIADQIEASLRDQGLLG